MGSDFTRIKNKGVTLTTRDNRNGENNPLILRKRRNRYANTMCPLWAHGATVTRSAYVTVSNALPSMSRFRAFETR